MQLSPPHAVISCDSHDRPDLNPCWDVHYDILCFAVSHDVLIDECVQVVYTKLMLEILGDNSQGSGGHLSYKLAQYWLKRQSCGACPCCRETL